MDVILRRANRLVRLIMKSGMVLDGKEGTVAVDTKAYVKDAGRDQFAATGNVTSGKAFYIPPLRETPRLPLRIEYSGVTYDVVDLHVYTDLRGAVKGYRMMVAG